MGTERNLCQSKFHSSRNCAMPFQNLYLRICYIGFGEKTSAELYLPLMIESFRDKISLTLFKYLT